MFEAARDQAAGLRRLFRPQPMSLLPLGCAMADASERAGVESIARALARAGRRPLLVDLLGGAPGVSRDGMRDGMRDAARGGADGDAHGEARGSAPGGPARPYARVDAHALLPEGAGTRDFTRFLESLARPAHGGDRGFDVALVAADPLRLADLAAGVADRIVLVARARGDGLARTYSQIKAMHLAHGFRAYCAVFLDAGSRSAALASHRRLAETAARFLGAAIEFGGTHDAIDETRFTAETLHWAPRPASVPPAHAH